MDRHNDQQGRATTEAERVARGGRRGFAYKGRPGQDGTAPVDGNVNDHYAARSHGTPVADAGAATGRLAIQRGGMIAEPKLQLRRIVRATPVDGGSRRVVQPPDRRQVPVGR